MSPFVIKLNVSATLTTMEPFWGLMSRYSPDGIFTCSPETVCENSNVKEP
jgi:hypothetical protein